jgi:ferrous iron transport protein A
MELLTADTLFPQQQVEISEVEESEVSLKLLEMGILPGKKLRLLHTAPFGDPIAYQIDDSVIALRKGEARYIKVFMTEAVV